MSDWYSRAREEDGRTDDEVMAEIRTGPAYCEIHQHRKWCNHNGGVLGATGYEAPRADDDDAEAEARFLRPIR